MSLADWIDRYPQVKALLQQDGYILEYKSKGDRQPPPIADITLSKNGQLVTRVDAPPGDIAPREVVSLEVPRE